MKRVHPAMATKATTATTMESLLLEERTRWAMYIHDGLTQSVTSALLELQTLRHRIETEPEGALETLQEIEDVIRQDLRQIREMLFELQDGPHPAQPPLAGIVSDLADRWKLSAKVSLEGNLDVVPGPVLEAAHGILAEALANVARHSGTRNVTVRVRATGKETTGKELTIEVVDRGRGIPLAAVTGQDQHFGLQLMRARAEETGGTIDIQSTPGIGTRVVAVLPVGGRGEVG